MNYLKISVSSNEEWLEKRKEYITATQCIFAIQNFSNDKETKQQANKDCLFPISKYSFFKKKTMTKEQQDIYDKIKKQNKAFKVGTRLEEEVSNIGFDVIKTYEGYSEATITYNGMTIWTYEGADVIATPDYIIDVNGRKELLECKTTSEDVDNDKKAEKLLNYYKYQVQQQLLCSGLDVAWLVMCGKDKTGEALNGSYRIFKIEKDEKLFEIIKQSCKDCLSWIKQNQEEIKDEDLKIYDIYDYEEQCLSVATMDNLKNFVLDYKNKINEIKLSENIVEICKALAKNNINIDGIQFVATKTKNTYYTIENIDKDIEKKEKEIKELQQLRDRVINGENDILKREGNFTLKDIKSV